MKKLAMLKKKTATAQQREGDETTRAPARKNKFAAETENEETEEKPATTKTVKTDKRSIALNKEKKKLKQQAAQKQKQEEAPENEENGESATNQQPAEETEQEVPVFKQKGRKSKEMVFDLEEVNWKKLNLPSFQKDFYKEHDSVSKMAKEDVEAFKEQNEVRIYYKGGDDKIPNPITEFEHTCFPAYMLQIFKECGYKKPTPIQAQSWPIVLKGHDMIGIAETGSGKTISFVLPGIVHLMHQMNENEKMKALREQQKKPCPIMLVLTPTRELALQIYGECQKFSKLGLSSSEEKKEDGEEEDTSSDGGLKVVCIFGGENRRKQVRKVKEGVDIVIATPGRLLDYLDAKIVSLQHITYLVLDEADRMLDMGFAPQITQIISQIRPDRQTLMFSATWSKEIQSMAQRFLQKTPFMVNIGAVETTANHNVKQQFLFIQEEDKMDRLLKLFDELVDGSDSCKILMFCQTKKRVDYVTEKLRVDGWPALSLHGDRTQQERDWVIQEFHKGEAPFLVATDVAARGLDIKDIKYVINVDLPFDIETYVHRIGRTGRAGRQGYSISFFSPENVSLSQSLHRILLEAKQEVPPALEKLCSTIEKKKKQIGQQGTSSNNNASASTSKKQVKQESSSEDEEEDEE